MIDIKGFKEYLYEEELSENTVETYIQGVKRYAEMYDTISKPNLLSFKKYLLDNFKPKTINNRITAILNYCKYKGIPMKLKQVKEPKQTYIDNVITVQQYEKLTAGLKNDCNFRWYSYITLLSKTGMRISEALRVTKADILHGSVTMQAKAHMRTIYFPKSLIGDIMPYLDSIEDRDVVMMNHKGKPLTSRGVSERLQEFAKKYDIPKEVMHPHSFRHFFAIEFLKRNNNISFLADLLGHGSVNITQIYLRQSQEEQKSAIDKAVDW